MENKRNFFNPKSNNFISAIIYNTASWDEKYSEENTVLFLNPYAKNKITVEDFKNMKCWIYNNKGKEYKLVIE